MVDQSELAWRILSRKYGGQLAYTPMINAKMFYPPLSTIYRQNSFSIPDEGSQENDRPLIVQFCANDSQQLLESAKMLEGHCDAIDINLGCPQEIARKGKYGAWIMDDWELVYRLSTSVYHTSLSLLIHGS